MMLISKVRINRQGYETPSGKYYGVGLPVYRASDRDSGDIVYEGRHATRAGAMAPAKAAYARWLGKGQRNPSRRRRTVKSSPMGRPTYPTKAKAHKAARRLGSGVRYSIVKHGR